MNTKVTWLGHSCFRIEKDGFVLITDPYEEGSVPGLKKLDETADMVIKTHDHFDHNALGQIKIRKDGKENPFEITAFKSYHDDKKGLLRGRNTIYSIRADVVHIVHMGDIGCVPKRKIIDAIKGCDVLLIPVGGTYTVDAAQALELIRIISPACTVPMHFRRDGFGFSNIQHLDEFLSLAGAWAEAESSSLTAGLARGITVLTPLYAK